MGLIGLLALVAVVVASAAFALMGASQLSTNHTGVNGTAGINTDTGADIGADIENYMVSRNQIGGPLALATVTASAMGAWILFSPVEAGSAFGGITAILGYCLGSALAIFLFVFVGPRLRQIMPWGHSLNEYVRHRFADNKFADNRFAGNSFAGSSLSSQGIYWLTVGVMLLYMFVYLAAELTAIAQALQLIVGVPLLVTSFAVMLAVYLYTTVGGLKATILTDAVQFVLIVPLLLVCFVMTLLLLGGWSQAFAPVAEELPTLLSFSNIDGLRFGATLLIAIVAAELFNQANWQRVYACRDEQTVRRSFLGSSLVILPMILIAGLLGLIAAGQQFVGATAFFDLLFSLQVPNWVAIALVILALALVMSSIDSLLNGISSVFTSDLLRLSQADRGNNGENGGENGNTSHRRILNISRVLTVLVGVPAVAIAAQGYSVLYLFFIADLLCAALLFPLVFSLYSRHQTATNALVSAAGGLIVGIAYFPQPNFAPLFNIPGGGDLLNSFAAALIVSTLVTLLWNAASKNNKNALPFSYRELANSRPYKTPVVTQLP